MKAILVDDELNSLEALSILLGQYCPQVEMLGQYRYPHDAVSAINKDKPDLVFLDIEMPGMNGFELLESLEERNMEVIFVTAYDHYAINAIKVSAMDYLLKPVDEEELIKAVQKANERLKERNSSKQLDVLLTNIKGLESGFQKLAIPTLEGLNFVNIKDIFYCSADGNYTSIFTVNNDKYIISKTLKDTEEMLQHPSFFRTHQSFLVNLNYIRQYIKGSGGQLILQDDTVIPVARARKEALLRLIYK